MAMYFRASGLGPSLGLVALLVCVCLPFGALSCSEHSRSDVLAILAEGPSEVRISYAGSAVALEYNSSFSLRVTPTLARYRNAMVESAEQPCETEVWQLVIPALASEQWDVVPSPSQCRVRQVATVWSVTIVTAIGRMYA